MHIHPEMNSFVQYAILALAHCILIWSIGLLTIENASPKTHKWVSIVVLPLPLSQSLWKVKWLKNGLMPEIRSVVNTSLRDLNIVFTEIKHIRKYLAVAYTRLDDQNGHLVTDIIPSAFYRSVTLFPNTSVLCVIYRVTCKTHTDTALCVH